MSVRHRSFFRTISFALIFFMFFNLVGFSFVEAKGNKGINPNPKKEKIQADVGELPNKAPLEKVELKSKRTKYSTRYINPDGSFTEEIYIEPTFYQDPSDKQWKKIDNGLKNSNKKIGKLENKANDFSAFFSNSLGKMRFYL